MAGVHGAHRHAVMRAFMPCARAGRERVARPTDASGHVAGAIARVTARPRRGVR
jgi:hypothetical protein